jgi:nucleolar protein 14
LITIRLFSIAKKLKVAITSAAFTSAVLSVAMAGSQLKRLKASLKEQGIVGPQQSKKQKRRNAQDERSRNDKRLQRGVVLEGIREQFNPFDLKHTKGPKFEVTSNRPTLTAGSIKGRPGQAKAASEERVSSHILFARHRRDSGGDTTCSHQRLLLKSLSTSI